MVSESARTLDTGLVLAAAAALAMSFLIEFAAVGFVVFFLVFLAPPIALAIALAARPRPWLHVAAAAAILVVAAMFFASSAPFLRHPMTFARVWGQLGVLLFGIAFLLAAAGIVGFLVARRSGLAPGWRDGWPRARNAIVLLALAFVAGMAVSSALVVANPLQGTGYAFTPESAVDIRITETDDRAHAEPEEVPLAAGRLVEVRVVNENAVLVTFVFPGSAGEYRHDVPPGSQERFLVRFERGGNVEFRAESADPNAGSAIGRFVVT